MLKKILHTLQERLYRIKNNNLIINNIKNIISNNNFKFSLQKNNNRNIHFIKDI